MVRIALAALCAAWSLQQFDAQFLLPVPAWAWAAAALLLWHCGGMRLALPLLMAAWTLSQAGTLIGQRLPEELAGRDILVRGVVCDFPRSDPGVLRFLIVREIDGTEPWAGRRLQLSWYDDAPALRPGERWQLKLRLRPPRGLRNPGSFDFEHWLYVRGIAATGYVRPSALNRPLSAAAAACPVDAGRGRVAALIEGVLGDHPAVGYVLGVTVGARSRLQAADWDLLRRTGTTHLLAISGLHIAMVAAPFMLAWPVLVRGLPVLGRWPLAGVVPALLAATGYAALAGFAVSTVRALVMLSVAAAIALRRQRVEGVDLLATAAIIVLVLDPTAAVSVSFWLSFVAVAWLFIAAPTNLRTDGSERRSGFRARLGSALLGLTRVQIALGLGLAPLALAWFQQLSLIAPLANLIAVPVFSLVIVPAALAGTALLAFAPSLGAPLLHLAAEVMSALLSVLAFAAGLRLASWQPAVVDTTALALAAAAALLGCWWRPVPLRSLAPLLLLPLVCGVAWQQPALRLMVFDVGQGLAVLVRTPRHALLYDTGPAFRQSDAGASVIVPALRRAGVGKLDALVISHYDQDHAGGAGAILEAFPGTLLIAPRPGALAAAAFESCAAGQAWEWDEVRFSIVSPDAAGIGRSDNDESCVLRVAWRDVSLLLPGDIERRREEELVRSGRIEPVDLVLAPHHGSRTSSSAPFVAATRPRFVVFSAGHRNRWGFPVAEVSARWRAGGACLLETADTGALTFDALAGGGLRLARRERIDGAHLWTAAAGPAAACLPAGPR